MNLYLAASVNQNISENRESQKKGMPKVLIITYYWPPAGGGGVQRWLKFAKYLPEFGWQPVIYTPSNADYPLLDPSLVKEIHPQTVVVKHPIFEPRRVYQKLLRIAGRKQSSESTSLDSIVRKPRTSMSWHQRVALLIRSNLFIPDARSPWISPSVRFLSKYLKENPVDLLITTGPPHSCHLIGLKLKQRLGIKWIADFRDPWMDIEFFPMLQLTARSRRKHERLQSQVLSQADRVMTVSWHWADLLKQSGARHTEVLTNGWDREDIENLVIARTPGKLVLASVGTLEEDRNPHDLWKALTNILDNNPSLEQRLELHLIGRVDEQILNAINDRRVRNVLHLHGYIPHAEAMQIMGNADILILSLNKSHEANARGLIPGKVFEYIATRNNIIVIGDQNSDVGRIISMYEKGYVVKDGDIDTLAAYLQRFVTSGTDVLSGSTQRLSPEKFERRQLTGELVNLMQSMK